MHIIDDESPSHMWQPPVGCRLGRINPARSGYGDLPQAPKFDSKLLIPKSEWQDRIKEMEFQKSRISDWCDQAGLKVLNQGQTNFCWANAPVHCVEIIRVMMNQPAVKLSPASVACKVNGFRNEGNWAGNALGYMVQNGVVPADLWPENAIDKQFDKAENWKAAGDFKLTNWWELQPRNMDELVSCLLRRIPVAIGLNWWGHEVTAVDAVWVNGGVAIRIDNSWGETWGDKGRGILSGSKMYADDAFAPVAVLAS